MSTLKVDTIQNSAGTGGPSFSNGASGINFPSDAINNLGLAASVATNALTIALKQFDASTDPASGTDAVTIGMRSSTLTSGAYNQRSSTAATYLTVASGATLGSTNNQPFVIWVYAIDNSGTIELAVSNTLFRDDALMTTTALSGSSNSSSVAYSTTARTNVPSRLIGKITITETTAGTWTAVPTQIQIAPFATSKVPTIQRFTTGSSLTYNTPAGCTWIKVKMVGGGGGGGASGSGAFGAAATNGTATSFGANTANQGNAGSTSSNGGAGGSGGSVSFSLGTQVLNQAGQQGQGGFSTNVGAIYDSGSMGGSASYFGGGGSGQFTGAGFAATANSGGGGAGGGDNNTTGVGSGGGGGSGAFMEFIITNPNTSYTYTVGSGGSAGVAGTGGFNGGAGAAGQIIVEEYYT